MNAQKRKYELCTYDLWRNAEGSWEVNNVFRTGLIIEISEDTSDAAINRKLGKAGAINAQGVRWEGEFGYSLYGEYKRNGKQAAELRPVE